MNSLLISTIIFSLIRSSVGFMIQQHYSSPSNRLLGSGQIIESSRTTTSTTSLPMLLSESSHWISTIDADIANIPENEFAPVFMGGIMVMFGGVISAIILGFILEKGDLYASVVADSYRQEENDEEFWRSLSAEERAQGKEILRQLEVKNGNKLPISAMPEMILDEETSNKKEGKPLSSAPSATKNEVDMFSDY